MTLTERLQADLVAAMRSGDTTSKETLRMTIAAIKNRRIELGRELEDAEAVAVVQKAVKSRLDSASQFDDAGRDELAAKERAEIVVLEAYLPAQLSEDDVRGIVGGLVEELGAAGKGDIGKVMKAVMARHRGEVDGKLVQQIAAELLG
jgi:uncharacterized protein YqeY